MPIDLENVERDETKRQTLIMIQAGDGLYNPTTGVYKWGTNVYDLTKTNGEIGLGLLPMKTKTINYKL